VEAYSALVELFEGRLHAFVLKRVPSAADAEDLTQEAFIRAWQRIGQYRPEWRFSTWLFTIASRLAVSQIRRTKPVGVLKDAHPGPGPQPASGGSGARIWVLVEDCLNADQQTAVWLRYVEDMAITDIARVMSRSQVSVRVMLFRARGILAQRLERDEHGDVRVRVVAAAGGGCEVAS
jgi:RNA polymerase sigma-70 factor (ECF subfamily)